MYLISNSMRCMYVCEHAAARVAVRVAVHVAVRDHDADDGGIC